MRVNVLKIDPHYLELFLSFCCCIASAQKSKRSINYHALQKAVDKGKELAASSVVRTASNRLTAR